MVPLGKYQHYKGGLYEVMANGLYESTQAPVVIYKALYNNEKSEVWVRDEVVFLEEVYVNGNRQPRFKKI